MPNEANAALGPVIELEGALDVRALQQLGQILLRMPRGARAGIDLRQVRDASAFTLARLGLLLVAACHAGRRVALLGLSHGQLQLLRHLTGCGVRLTSR